MFNNLLPKLQGYSPETSLSKTFLQQFMCMFYKSFLLPRPLHREDPITYVKSSGNLVQVSRSWDNMEISLELFCGATLKEGGRGWRKRVGRGGSHHDGLETGGRCLKCNSARRPFFLLPVPPGWPQQRQPFFTSMQILQAQRSQRSLVGL